MKKTLSFILFAAAVLTGCKKDIIETKSEENNPGEQITIVGYLDDASKLSLVDGVKLGWAVGDQITLGNNKKFTVSSVDPDNPAKAYFTGTAPTSAATYRAFYPTLSYSSTAGRFLLSDTQNYGLDDKLTNVNYMYAETTDYKEIHFHNVCGILAIDLKGEGTVSNIEIAADQYLSGTLDGMSFSQDGALTYTGWYSSYSSTPTKYVDLGCGKSATLSKDTARRFYVAVPETDYTNLKVIITTDKGTMVVPATKTASVKKNNIYHLPEITVDIKPLEFDAKIEVVKNEATVTSLDFAISATPTDKNVYYILGIEAPGYVGQGGYEFSKKDIAYYSGVSLSTLVQYGIAFKGDCAEYKPSYNLSQDTDYVAYAYAVDEYFNVSAPITLNVHTAKAELPVYSAQYSDYLGDWAIGANVIKVEELVNGETYKVTGISNLTNSYCTIPYVTASFEKGNFVINEQFLTTASTPYGEANFNLSALTKGNPNYPFTSTTPSMILFGQYSSNKINVYSSYDAFGVTFVVLSGSNAGKGMILSPSTTIPSEMKHPETADPDYRALVGTYTYSAYDYFNEGPVSGTLVVEEYITNESYKISLPGSDWGPESGSYIDHFICPWDKSGKKSFSIAQGAKGDMGITWNYGEDLGTCGIQLDLFYYNSMDNIDAIVLTADESGNLSATAPAVPAGDYICFQSGIYNASGETGYANGIFIFINGMTFTRSDTPAMNNAVQHSVFEMPVNNKGMKMNACKQAPVSAKANTMINVAAGTADRRIRIAR